MSSTLTQKEYNVTTDGSWLTEFNDDLAALYNWDSAEEIEAETTRQEYYTGNSSSTAYLSNGTLYARRFCINDSGSGAAFIDSISQKTGTYGIAVPVCRLGYTDGTHTYTGGWFAVGNTYTNDADRLNLATIARRNDGFCFMMGGPGTRTSSSTRPRVFGVCPATNMTDTTDKGACIYGVFPYASSPFLSGAAYVVGKGTQAAVSQQTTLQDNIASTLHAVPLYGIGCDYVPDDHLLLQTLPDQLHCRVVRVKFSGKDYYRMGSVLVPFEE